MRLWTGVGGEAEGCGKCPRPREGGGRGQLLLLMLENKTFYDERPANSSRFPVPTPLAETPDNHLETAGPRGALRSLAVQLGGRGAGPWVLVAALRPLRKTPCWPPPHPGRASQLQTANFSLGNLFWRPFL